MLASKVVSEWLLLPPTAGKSIEHITNVLCMAHECYRFANGLPGLASAYADRSPILVITSSAPTADLETNPVQGILDQVDIARQMTKFAERVPEPEEIPRFVARAFRVAISGAPGALPSVTMLHMLTDVRPRIAGFSH